MIQRVVFALFVATFGIQLFQSAAIASPSENAVDVTFRVTSCPKYGGTPPAISLSVLPSLKDRKLDVVPTFAGGVWTFETLLDPNKYFTTALGGLYCAYNGAFTLLPGHKRSIVIILGPRLMIGDSTDSLAGALPFDGLGVSLVSPEGAEVTAVVEDRAYYFNFLKDGKYTLKVLVQNRDYVEIPVEVKGPQTRHDVTLADLLNPTPL